MPTDPSILARLGEMHDNEGDKSAAFQYHYDVSRSYQDGSVDLLVSAGLLSHAAVYHQQTTEPTLSRFMGVW